MPNNYWVLILGGDIAPNVFNGQFLENPNVNLNHGQNDPPWNRFWVRSQAALQTGSTLTPITSDPIYMNPDVDRLRTINKQNQQDCIYIAASIIDSSQQYAPQKITRMSFVCTLDAHTRKGNNQAPSAFVDGNGNPLPYVTVPSPTTKIDFQQPVAAAATSYTYIGPFSVGSGAGMDRRFFELTVYVETATNATFQQFIYDPDMCVCNGSGSTVPPGLLFETTTKRGTQKNQGRTKKGRP